MNYDAQGFNQALCDMFYLNITNRILERDYNNIIPSLRLYRLLKDKLHYANKVTTTDIKVNDHVSGKHFDWTFAPSNPTSENPDYSYGVLEFEVYPAAPFLGDVVLKTHFPLNNVKHDIRILQMLQNCTFKKIDYPDAKFSIKDLIPSHLKGSQITTRMHLISGSIPEEDRVAYLDNYTDIINDIQDHLKYFLFDSRDKGDMFISLERYPTVHSHTRSIDYQSIDLVPDIHVLKCYRENDPNNYIELNIDGAFNWEIHRDDGYRYHDGSILSQKEDKVGLDVYNALVGESIYFVMMDALFMSYLGMKVRL